MVSLYSNYFKTKYFFYFKTKVVLTHIFKIRGTSVFLTVQTKITTRLLLILAFYPLDIILTKAWSFH